MAHSLLRIHQLVAFAYCLSQLIFQLRMAFLHFFEKECDFHNLSLHVMFVVHQSRIFVQFHINADIVFFLSVRYGLKGQIFLSRLLGISLNIH